MDDSPTDQRPGSSQSVRMGISIALAILFGVVLFTANHTAWITATVLDEDRFVSALAPLPSDPDVSLALGHQVADAVVETYEVSDRLADTLPEEIEFLAIPLTTGVHELIANVGTEIIRSDAFTTVWTAALTGSHKVATAYVGVFEDGAVVEEDGVAVLDLTELGQLIADQLGTDGFGLLDNVEADLTVTLFELPDSGIIKTIVDLMSSVRWASIILVVVLIAAAYVVAPDRRRITTWIGGAAVVAMLLSLIDIRYLRSAATGGVEDPIQRAGAEAAWDIIFSRFIWQTWVVLLIGLAMILIVWAIGDSKGALGIRSAVLARTDTMRNGGDAPQFLQFVSDRRRLIEWGFTIIVVAFLLFGPPAPIWLVLAILVLLALVVAGVEYLSAAIPEDAQQ